MSLRSLRALLPELLTLRSLALTFALLGVLAAPTPEAIARDPAPRDPAGTAASGSDAVIDGIPVPKRSRVAGLASSEALEKQGSLQYRQLLEQAAAKRALVPADHPQRQRLIRIAQRLLPHTRRFSPRATEWRWRST